MSVFSDFGTRRRAAPRTTPGKAGQTPGGGGGGGAGAPTITAVTATPLQPTVSQLVSAIIEATGSITLSTMNWGDGGPVETVTANVSATHAYGTIGTVTATGSVSGPGGSDSDISSPIVVITGPAPDAALLSQKSTKIAGAGTSVSSQIVVPSGSNKMLLAKVMAESTTANITPTAVVFRSQASGIDYPMTKATDVLQSNGSASVYAGLWYLLNPPQVSGSVRVTHTSAPIRAIISAEVFSNVKQVVPPVVRSQGVELAVVNTTLDTAGFPECFIVDCMAQNNASANSVTNGPQQVLIESIIYDAGGGAGMAGGSSWQNASSEGVYTAGWTIATGARIAHAMAAFRRTGDAAVTPPTDGTPATAPDIALTIAGAAGNSTVTVSETVSGLVSNVGGSITLATIAYDATTTVTVTPGQFDQSKAYAATGTVTASAAASGPGGSDTANFVVTVVAAPPPPPPPPPSGGFEITYDAPPAPDQPANTSVALTPTVNYDFTSAVPGAVTVTRATSAWDHSDGTIVSYSSGTARRTNARGLLIEGSAINEVLNNASLSAWTKIGCTVATGITDPRSTPGTNAVRLTEDTNAGEHYIELPTQAFTNGGGDRYHWAEAIVKASTRTKGYIKLFLGGDPTQFVAAHFDLTAGTVYPERSTEVQGVTTAPLRDSVVAEIVALSSSFYIVRIGARLAMGSPTSTNLQMRIGAKDASGATNYTGAGGTTGLVVYAPRIRTAYDLPGTTLDVSAGSTITRNAENVQFSPSTNLDNAAGTLFFSLPERGRKLGTLLDTTNGGLGGDGIRIAYDAVGNLFVHVKDVIFTTQAINSFDGTNPDAHYSDGTAAVNDTLPAHRYKGIMVTYDNTGIKAHGWDGTYIRALGGNAGNPGTPTAGAVATLGHLIGNTYYLDNWVAKFKAYAVKLTDAQALWLFDQEGV